MAEEYGDVGSQEYVAPDFTTRFRELEDRQRLLRERILLLGKTHIAVREKNFAEVQDLKKTVLTLKGENDRMKELLERVTEQLGSVVRKEELAIVQRQLDILRGK